MRYALIALILMVTTAQAGKLKERDYQARFCAGMKLEVPTKSGSRADCVSDTHAIEVDWPKKWAEAIGQSLHYASELNLKAGTRDMVTIIKKIVKPPRPARIKNALN